MIALSHLGLCSSPLQVIYSNGSPKYVQTAAVCGVNGVTNENLFQTSVKQLIVTFPSNGAISSLTYRWCPPSSNTAAQAIAAGPNSAAVCPRFVSDFSGVAAGQYITNDLETNFGFIVSGLAWSGGYTPNAAVRIFDTAKPGSASGRNAGDPALGSPNSGCPGGGPGSGSGGASNSPYSNCVAQGHVLVIQKSQTNQPSDNPGGGSMRFSFDRPAYVESVTVMNNNGNTAKSQLMCVKTDGSATALTGPNTGANGVAVVPVNQDLVNDFWVSFPTNGAVSQIVYRMCR